MQSLIRFSLFGNFEGLNTTNYELYLKQINFWAPKGYHPVTTNELQLQPNGQPYVLVMPLFINDKGAALEISSGRINFRMVVEKAVNIAQLISSFKDEFYELLEIFPESMNIKANRVALNVDFFRESSSEDMPIQSGYYNEDNIVESSVRNAARCTIGKEGFNIILEKYVNYDGNFIKYSYDINTLAENQDIRFDSSRLKNMYDICANVAREIEERLC